MLVLGTVLNFESLGHSLQVDDCDACGDQILGEFPKNDPDVLHVLQVGYDLYTWMSQEVSKWLVNGS